MAFNHFHSSDMEAIEPVFRRGGSLAMAAAALGRSKGSLQIYLSRNYGGVRAFCHTRGFRYNQRWKQGEKT